MKPRLTKKGCDPFLDEVLRAPKSQVIKVSWDSSLENPCNCCTSAERKKNGRWVAKLAFPLIQSTQILYLCPDHLKALQYFITEMNYPRAARHLLPCPPVKR